MATIITHFDFLRALFDFGAFLGALLNFSFFLGTLFGFGGAFWFWDAFWLFGCAFCILGRFLLFWAPYVLEWLHPKSWLHSLVEPKF